MLRLCVSEIKGTPMEEFSNTIDDEVATKDRRVGAASASRSEARGIAYAGQSIRTWDASSVEAKSRKIEQLRHIESGSTPWDCKPFRLIRERGRRLSAK